MADIVVSHTICKSLLTTNRENIMKLTKKYEELEKANALVSSLEAQLTNAEFAVDKLMDDISAMEDERHE